MLHGIRLGRSPHWEPGQCHIAHRHCATSGEQRSHFAVSVYNEALAGTSSCPHILVSESQFQYRHKECSPSRRSSVIVPIASETSGSRT